MTDVIVGPVDNGVNTGDILRWNVITSKWEAKTEPLIFDEINLKPKASSTGAEGTMFYCSDDNYVYVATE